MAGEKYVKYKGLLLMKGSRAYDLHMFWQSAETETLKKEFKAKLDRHMAELETNYNLLTYGKATVPDRV